MRWLALVALLFIPNCQCSSSSGITPDAELACSPACGPDEACRYEVCVPTPTSCETNADCEGDTYCDVTHKECLPWGVGPGGAKDDTCKREPVPGVFFPTAQCEWIAPTGNDFPNHKNVLATPVVATFYSQGEFSTPSIVFTSYNFTDGGSESCQSINASYYGVVRIIDGRTCMPQATISSPTLVASASLAVADLAGGPTPEIVGARSDGGLVAWTLMPTGWEVLWQTPSVFADTLCNWAGPSIHDLDDDGNPEVLFYGNIYNGQTGAAIDETLGASVDSITVGYIPVAADVDGDGNVELITGSTLYTFNKTTKKWEAPKALGGANGFVAVADFGTYPAAGTDDRATLDGIAEVALVANGAVRVITRDGRTIFNATLQGAASGYGGPPTIADFDGDGRIEFASAGGVSYNVFDIDCQGTPAPATCPSMTTNGVLWTQPSQDSSSNKTGSSVFDFDGDGRAEVVYGDECFTRVYDGVTGKVFYSRYRSSCTWYENPLVVDSDADFNAEIISTSNNNCNVTCPAVDPIFDGVQCLDDTDCPGTTACGRDQPGDVLGRCRCQSDPDCGGDGFVCLDPLAGAAAGKVCRASHPGKVQGVRVLADSIDRWVNTRTIWNQHAYSVTNIDGAGKVPRTSEWLRNWTQMGLNNYRQNSPGEGVTAGAIPDLTVRQVKVTCDAGGTIITAEVCNRGTEPVAPGLPVTVYAGSQVACTTQTGHRLDPGFCTPVSCVAPGVSGTGKVVVDDRGTAGGVALECREDNNEESFTVSCP